MNIDLIASLYKLLGGTVKKNGKNLEGWGGQQNLVCEPKKKVIFGG